MATHTRDKIYTSQFQRSKVSCSFGCSKNDRLNQKNIGPEDYLIIINSKHLMVIYFGLNVVNVLLY
jgi:hypothetical protein